MEKQKVDITNTSPKMAAILLIFIAMNTCVSMAYQELAYQKQKEQLEQAKKQYTLDSLQYVQDTTLYNNMVRFKEEYLKAAKKQQATDSLLNMAAQELGRDVRAKTKQSEKTLKFVQENIRQR
jgi:hypothetical protein